MTAGFRVTVEAEFAYAHRLPGYRGKCARLHGHNGLVRVEVEAPRTDRRGMVVDFGDVKEALRTWLAGNLDHRVLLQRDDPLAAILRDAGQEVAPFEGAPTAESIARRIFEGLRAEGIAAAAVEFRETPTSSAIYRP